MSNVKQLPLNLPTPVIRPTTIGKFAAQALGQASSFSIRGITSRGIFTLVDERTIVFLSRERYKGPLIVNIDWIDPILEQITLTSHGRIIGTCFQFDDLDLMIDCSDGQIWSTLSIWNPSTLPQDFPTEERVIDFLNQLLKRSENEFVSIVLGLISGTGIPLPGLESEIASEIQQLSSGLRTGVAEQVNQSARFFAGRGRGLTPSGDDLLLGIVYALFSFKKQLTPGQIALIKPMVDLVKQRSTLISANLLECAAFGEVDERIAKAFYTILTPDQSMNQAAADLVTWGSSSGMDAAAGFCLMFNYVINI